MLNAAASESGAAKSRRERADPSRRHTLVTCACVAALAGLDTLARKYRGKQSPAQVLSPLTRNLLVKLQIHPFTCACLRPPAQLP